MSLVEAPGSWRAPNDCWLDFPDAAQAIGPGALWVVDARVQRLHPAVAQAIDAQRPLARLTLTAGEGAKSFRTLQRLSEAAQGLRRGGTLVCVGGGTLGDLCTVAAHLLKRGVCLVQVPSTLLAAVDSSVGGKGALNVGTVKNAVGVFHYAQQSFLCPELWQTLSAAQLREGALEAWKMAVTLDARAFSRWSGDGAPELKRLVRTARTWKHAVCAQDPYETRGLRQVLNFGHTFGHVLESLSAYHLAHGEAVGLGMLCALDVGVQQGVTPQALADEVEDALVAHAHVQSRAVIRRLLRSAAAGAVASLLRADKKGDGGQALQMVLLEAPGRTASVKVPPRSWRAAVQRWAK